MNVPQHSSPAHDEYLVARLAAGDLAGRELQQAQAQLAACEACAALAADLAAIQAATVQLPAAARSRDFRLTETDAVRLRRSGWRAALARFGEPRFAFTMPLAGGLAAIGIVGLLVSSLSFSFATAGTAPSSHDSTPVMGQRASSGAGLPEVASAAPAPAVSAAASAPASTNRPAPASASASAFFQATSAPASARPTAPDAGSTGGKVVQPPPPPSGGQLAVGNDTNGTSEVTSGPGQPVKGATDGRTSSQPYSNNTPPGGVAPVAPAPGSGGPAPSSYFWLAVLVAGVAIGALRLAARRQS